MAAKLKESDSFFPSVQKLKAESYERLVASCERPPKPTAALRELMNPTSRVMGRNLSGRKS